MKMTEYIEREAVIELFNKWADGYSYIEVPTKDAIACGRAIPAADVVPVRHGRWLIKTIRGDKRTVCSECLLETGTCYEENYCPNCGADMRYREES